MSPVHFPEKKKEKIDPEIILQRLRSWYGNRKYYSIDIDHLKKYQFPLNFFDVRKIDPKKIPLSSHTRLKCGNCGLWNRAVLCFPRLKKTYPEFSTFKSTREWLDSSIKAFIFIWKNNGQKPWKIDWNEISHIDFKKVGGRKLKGVEVASSKAINKFMSSLRDDYNNSLYDKKTQAISLIAGHCDNCGRYCPLRDIPNSRCKKGGMPSLEAIGIDVYKLLDIVGVDWEYPVQENDELTQVTMLIIRDKNDYS